MDPLPIDQALPALRDALLGGPAVLLAPPGSGKTTRVPLALLGERWLAGRRIVLLEPRRLAARAAAGWMARLLGEPVGARVGYRIRRDTRVGPATRIEVVTEGVLTRMLAADPGLAGVGLVNFTSAASTAISVWPSRCTAARCCGRTSGSSSCPRRSTAPRWPACWAARRS
jgi:ATP-dependent helicase HrpB